MRLRTRDIACIPSYTPLMGPPPTSYLPQVLTLSPFMLPTRKQWLRNARTWPRSPRQW